MKRVILALAVCLTLGVASSVRADDAKTVYGQKCASCHGADGKGQTPMGTKLKAPDLTATKLSEAEIAKVIGEGKKPKMMAYASLGDAQIQSLAKYVKGGVK